MQGALFETNIKYQILDKLLTYYITNVQYSNEINMFIDLKSIFKKVYRTDINSIIKEQRIVIEDITSHIINMIGFYRNYFYKKGKYTNVYLLYSTSECSLLKEIYPDYKKDYYNKYFNNQDEYKNLNNIIKSSVKQIIAITKYIPHTYFIDTSNCDEFCYFNYLSRHSGNSLNIVFSNDPILFQVLNKNTIALTIKGENSTVITENDAIKYLLEKDTILTGNSLNILLSIAGDKEYSLPNIPTYSYKKAEKLLIPFFKNLTLADKTYMNFPNELFSSNILNNNKNMILKNFALIFPIEIQMSNENKIIENLSFSKIKPNLSYNELLELNQKIFLLFPLNLNMIMKGEL